MTEREDPLGSLHPALRPVTWMFSSFVPKEFREALIGDLAEAYAVRVKAGSSSAAARWYLRQIFASMPSLLWTQLTRAAWPFTLGVASLAFFAVAFVDWAIKSTIPNWTPDGTFAPNPLGLVITFPIVALIGYFTEHLRCRAALVLGVMLLLVIASMMTMWPASSPIWYRISWLLIGPAAYLGGILCTRRRARS